MGGGGGGGAGERERERERLRKRNAQMSKIFEKNEKHVNDHLVSFQWSSVTAAAELNGKRGTMTPRVKQNDSPQLHRESCKLEV